MEDHVHHIGWLYVGIVKTWMNFWQIGSDLVLTEYRGDSHNFFFYHVKLM